jgi:hypothetical protein
VSSSLVRILAKTVARGMCYTWRKLGRYPWSTKLIHTNHETSTPLYAKSMHTLAHFVVLRAFYGLRGSATRYDGIVEARYEE